MSEFELSESTLETRYQNDDYEAPISRQSAENDYVSIGDIPGHSKQQDDPIHYNTITCSDSSECNNTRTARTYRRTQPDGPDADEKITRLSERQAETATALKRLKIICIVLGVALVISSMAIGALMLIMMERIKNAEQTSEEHFSKIEEKMSTITTDSEGVNHGHNTRIADLEQAATEGNGLVHNYSIRLLELEGAYNASGAVIEDHNTRIAELKQMSLNSVLMIQNHTAELLKFEMAHNTSKAAIERHSEKIADLESASFVSNTLIQNHTSELFELDKFQTTSSEEIKVLTSKIPELEKANADLKTELSGYDTTLERHTAKIANLEKVSFDSHYLILNHTAMLLELGKVQTTSSANVHVLTSKISELEKANTNINTELSGYETVIEGHTAKIANLEKVSSNSSTLILNHTAMISEIGKVQTNTSIKVQALTTKIPHLEKANIDINTILTDFNDTLRKTGVQIGFTAQGKNRNSSGFLIFNNLKTNYGYGYSSSTGIFTCRYPGLYFFSLSLIKQRADIEADWVYCYIKRNTNDLVKTFIDPNDAHADYGSYGTSTSITIHLAYGDLVYVAGCSSANSIDQYSTFSGFLLKHD